MRGLASLGSLVGIGVACFLLAGCDTTRELSANERAAPRQAAIGDSAMRQLATPWTNVLASGHALSVRTITALSPATARAGDCFVVELDDPAPDGKAAVPAGAQAIGRVILVAESSRGRERSRLVLELVELQLRDGRSLLLETKPLTWPPEKTSGRQARAVAAAAPAGLGRGDASAIVPPQTGLIFILARDVAIPTAGVPANSSPW